MNLRRTDDGARTFGPDLEAIRALIEDYARTDLCEENDIEVYEKDFSLMEVYSADESFVTGTFGGVKPVSHVDGRVIGDGSKGPVTERLGELYNQLLDKECE